MRSQSAQSREQRLALGRTGSDRHDGALEQAHSERHALLRGERRPGVGSSRSRSGYALRRCGGRLSCGIRCRRNRSHWVSALVRALPFVVLACGACLFQVATGSRDLSRGSHQRRCRRVRRSLRSCLRFMCTPSRSWASVSRVGFALSATMNHNQKRFANRVLGRFCGVLQWKSCLLGTHEAEIGYFIANRQAPSARTAERFQREQRGAVSAFYRPVFSAVLRP